MVLKFKTSEYLEFEKNINKNYMGWKILQKTHDKRVSNSEITYVVLVYAECIIIIIF